MKILFMGTPEIAATCLSSLIDAGENIVAALTREDKPRGRGHVMTPTPVKELCLAHGIPVYTPQTLRDEAFADLLAEIAPELIVVVAYGKILPKNVLDFPKYGCLNLHVSLLPKYRGAAPMQRAVMSGDKETGVTVMYMDEGMDTGDIVTCERFPIGPEDTFETVHDTSAAIGSKLLCRAVADLARDGFLPRTKQDDSQATLAPKVEKEDCKIDFTLPASVIDPRLRGVTPIPGAYAFLKGKCLKIAKALPVFGNGKPGEVIAADSVGAGSFTVACGEGALKILTVIPEGKGKMSAGDFLRGRQIAVGDILE